MAVELLDDESLTPVEDVVIEEEGSTEEPSVETSSENKASSLPSKYAGKSLEEIIQMHIEAEKLIGRQAQEVGEVRKLADELIKRELTKGSPNPSTKTEPEEVDFFDDPAKAVSKLVEQHPAVQSAKDAVTRMQRKEALENLERDHPDYGDIVSSADFAKWVSGSRVRQALFLQTDQDFDYEAANELLTSFKAIRSAQKSAEAEEIKNVSEQASKAKKAAAVTTGSAGDTGGKKIYRRAEILRKQITDPSWYEANADAILQAYSEGRVR